MKKRIACALVLAVPVVVPVAAQAKTCQRECKTSRTVPGNGALQWKTPQSFARDDQVLVTVYVNGHDVPGKVTGQNVTTYTRGLRTVNVITRARSSRIEVRVSNFADRRARVVVKFEQIAR